MQDYQSRSEKLDFSLRREKWYYRDKDMVYFIILFLEVVILFFLSRKMSKTLSRFISINFLSFLFLPGIIIHELSHLLIAVILFVPVGDMEFSPKKSDNGLKLGSVEIAKTGPIRRSIIGFAPVFLGLMIIIGIVYLFTSNILSSTDSVLDLFFKDKDIYTFTATLLIVGYLLFAITNTMFSSSRDMEGTVEIIVSLLIIVLLLYLIGVRVPLSWFWNFLESNLYLFQKAGIFLLMPIAIDLFILGAIRIFTGRRSRTGQT